MGGSVWELPTQPQKKVIIASDLEPALLNQWTHIPPEGPPLPHSTAKHWAPGDAAALVSAKAKTEQQRKLRLVRTTSEPYLEFLFLKSKL